MKRLAIFLVALAACRGHEAPATTGAKPDIILVTIDTLRADATGFGGNANVKTPFLDRMASEGIVFTNAHSHNVVTLPSHTNILTGLLPFQHGVRDNAGFRLDPKHETVAAMLRRAGYATGAFVGAFPLDARFGLNQGFDVYDDNYGKGAASLDFVVQERPASAVLDAATAWWRANEGRKRFLWIHLYDPHAPYRPPEPFASEYAANPYYGEIAAVDDALGKSLAPIADHALLVITADHGEALGDHGELTHGLFAYESTLHVPLIVREPGVVQHRVENAYARHIDIVPTILERAGVAKPAPLTGASLLHPLEAHDTYFEALSTNLNRGWAPLTGVIHGAEKYIELPVAELYDLPRDPAEAHNLREEDRRQVETLRRVLASFGPTTNAARGKVSTEEEERLRSLGYLGGSAAAKTAYTAADDPKNLVAIDNQMHEVVAAYEAHDLPRALRLANGIVAARPGMAAARELLAFVQQQSERPADAIASLRAAVQAGNATESMRVQLGLLLTEQGKSAEALAVLEPVARASSDPDTLNAYGIALADEGKLDAGAAQFQRVLAADPNNAPALQNLGIVALRRDDVAGAQSFLSRALELNPRLPLALNTMGVVYARQGDYARAVDAWNRAVAVDPRQYDALYNAGLVQGRTGHMTEAKAALLRFVQTAPKERYGADIEAAKRALEAMR